MSLLRLLTAGKCLVGIKDDASRYRLANPGALPKFGRRSQRSKNLESEPGAPGTEPGMPAIGIEAKTEAVVVAPSSGTASALAARAEVAGVPGGKEGQRGNPDAAAFAAAKLSASRASFWGRVRWFWPKLLGLGIEIPTRSKRPAKGPDPKTPVQTELCLDMVRVVRNDLSDADVEIVPQTTRSASQRSKASRINVEPQVPSGLVNTEKI